MNDVTIIGAGVIGSAIARELSRYQLKIEIVEQGSDVCSATSKANSGIVHAGFDATNGTLKARYNVEGSNMFPALAQELGFDFRNNGSLVLAFTDEEDAALEALLENGKKNGVQGLTILSRKETLALEPELSPNIKRALYAPTGGICNPYEATLAFAENALANGASLRLDTQVMGIQRVPGEMVCNETFCRHEPDTYTLTTRNSVTGEEGTIQTLAVVNAAGVFSDVVSSWVSADEHHITARRGEYCILDKRYGQLFNATVFRAPSAVGKGVLVSPTVDGNLIIGPNAHPVDRDDPHGAVDTTPEGIDEIINKAQDMWPGLSRSMSITQFAGLRATPDSHDFFVGEASDAPCFFNAVGIESPGLTAAPAIAKDLAQQIARALGAQERSDFVAQREVAPRFVDMTQEERAQRIAVDPAWGRMVCRCEQVTEAEIVAAIHAPIPATTLDAIKWRTRAGMGRCHAGFCSPLVAELLARETGTELNAVRKSGGCSFIGVEGGCGKANIQGKPASAFCSNDGAIQDISQVQLAVIGGGAGGIAAALSAEKQGVKHILLIDREQELGGILKQCIHPGFGLERYKEELTGPEYAARDMKELAESNIVVLKETTVTNLRVLNNGTFELQLVGPQGAQSIGAQSVVLATGSRERSRGQVGVSGDRPAGVYTAGSAQNLMNLRGSLPGRKVVIQGSGDIGLIMARRLAWEGAQVVGMTERGPYAKGLARNVAQCLDDNGIPLLTGHSIKRVIGKDRVEAVEMVLTDPATKEVIPGTEYMVECDTFLLSVGLIPEQDLITEAGISYKREDGSQSSQPGLFLCGNAAFIHDIVDKVTLDGEYAGACAASYITSAALKAEPPKAEEASHGAVELELTEGESKVICVCCPKGCAMKVSQRDEAEIEDVKEHRKHCKDGFYVEGNDCRRGLRYGIEEVTDPQRVLTSIVRCGDRVEPLSVRTDGTISKDAVPACLEALTQVCVTGPVEVGDVVLSNICGTGVNIVATKQKA